MEHTHVNDAHSLSHTLSSPPPTTPHALTQDECHYTSLIAELESNGARVVCIYSGGLDFSGPIEEYFYNKQGASQMRLCIHMYVGGVWSCARTSIISPPHPLQQPT